MAQQENQKYEESKLYRIRHSAAHVMAQAVLEMMPEAKYTIGPPIENGFYYDFELPRPLTNEDLPQIEKRMRQIIAGGHEFMKEVLPAEKAREIFQHQPYKLELIDGLEKGGLDEYGQPLTEKPEISIYKSDTFVDLCRGPHVENTKQINPAALKLMSIAGAYWRGDENNKMLTRIYGTAWEKPDELKHFLWQLEEAKKRDHRKVGKELGLFLFSEEVGSGLPLWMPKGGMIRHIIEDFCKTEHLKNGYEFVYTPHVGRGRLWEISGHLDFYKESMYSAIEMDKENYYVKPMNCPFHIMIYKSGLRSYRDLPIRYAEWGTVYRYELPGVLHGLLRVRGFTQDDAHIFCRPDQMAEEIDRTLKFCIHILKSFGFEEFHAYLSTRPEKAVGEIEKWDAATEALRAALDRSGISYQMDEGGGAFYGPKIDIKIKDTLGRDWQCSTIQFDFNLSERFDLRYVTDKGTEEQPYMIHRALLGSMERFFGILIEYYKGAFPVWLSPVQAMVIPISDRYNQFAEDVVDKLKVVGFRAEVDLRDDRMQAKIRDAQLEKIPYMLVVGEKEVNAQSVSVRLRSGQDLGLRSIDAVVEMLTSDVAEKK